jgi:hypothetical protein
MVGPSTGKPFAEQFGEFITTAESGVIVVTFGSLVDTLPEHIATKFIEAFR